MLKVSNLSISAGATQLVHDVSFAVRPGQRLGIIGESGSGKSLTALAIMGLLGQGLTATGSVDIDGQEVIGLPDRAMRKLRGRKVAMVFQEPMSALDPLMRVGKQLRLATDDVDAALNEVSLSPSIARRFPHQLSGGQRQRVLIAMAMASDPDVLICDEPTTALDNTTEDGIINVISQLTESRGTAVVFISHDLSVVARLCEDVMVMKDGRVVETGPTRQILTNPTQPYTGQLVAASQPGQPLPSAPEGEQVITVDKVTRRFGTTVAVDNVSFAVNHGQRLGIVGGSGSGKSTILKMLAGLDQPDSGAMHVNGRVQMVFQDPQGSLNPRMRILDIVAEGIPNRRELGPDAVDQLVADTLADVGIDAAAAGRYPHEFSGGQRQRISIARAIIGSPEVLLADEAVSALDVSVRAQVLTLLEELVTARGLTLVFVSHDLPVVRELCDVIAVMDGGRLVEYGPTDRVWNDPQHDYTRRLLGLTADRTVR